MILTATVSNSSGSFFIRTVDSSVNIEFGTGYETQVHPIVDGEPNIYKFLDYRYSSNRSQALAVHQEILDKWSKV